MTTLVFMMAAAGNFAQYLGNSAGMTSEKHSLIIYINVSFVCVMIRLVWHYDFYKVTYGAAVIYGYAAIIPLCFWGMADLHFHTWSLFY